MPGGQRAPRHRPAWLASAAIALVAFNALVLATNAAVAATPPAASPHAKPGSTAPGVAGASQTETPRASTIRLVDPAGLAPAPNGDLYIADQSLNQVLVRKPDGKLEVVAGTGRPGFSGDGGPAGQAELDAPTALALGPHGTLYFIDSGNNRVRAILPDGTIMTVAGGGLLSDQSIASGTPATEYALYPAGITIGPGGGLYIADDDGEILRLLPSGLFSEYLSTNKLPGVKLRFLSCGAGPIAFSASGKLFIGCTNSRQLVERVTPGRFTLVQDLYRPHDFPGLVAGPNGSMLVVNYESLFKVLDGKWSSLIGLSSFGQHRTFVPSGIAVGQNGAIYVSSQYGDGFTYGAALAEITPSGKTVLLGYWPQQ